MIGIQGVNAALLTPFAGSGEPLWSSVDQMVDFLLEKRIDGLFPASTTGEFVKLTLEQRKRLIDRVASRACGKLNLLAGCSAMTVEQVLDLARHARSAGCQAAIVCPPYYYPLSGEEIAVFYQRVSDTSPLPVIPYNIPLFTNEIPLEVLAAAARHPNVAAIKESSGDLLLLADLVRLLEGSPVPVLMGPDEFLYPALQLGAAGCVSGCSGVFPELVLELFAAHRAGQDQEGCRLQSLILKLMGEMHKLPFPFGLKLAMQIRGVDMGPFTEHFPARLKQLYQEVRKNLVEILGDRQTSREIACLTIGHSS